MKITLATGNKNKLKEVKEILPDYEIEGFSLDVEETGLTFKENAQIKAASVWKLVGGIVIADDSGMCVDALNGEPGIYSARYLGEDTPQTEKNKAILKKLEGLHGKDRSAQFVCDICAIMPNGEIIFVEGIMEGEISEEIKGDNGFGYDPVFYLPEYGKTVSELSDEEKNAISHRGKALRKIAAEINLFQSKLQ